MKTGGFSKEEIVRRFEMTEFNTVSTPLELGIDLFKDETSGKVNGKFCSRDEL